MFLVSPANRSGRLFVRHDGYRVSKVIQGLSLGQTPAQTIVQIVAGLTRHPESPMRLGRSHACDDNA